MPVSGPPAEVSRGLVSIRWNARAAAARALTALVSAVHGCDGYWEAMKGDMSGWFEVRVDGPRRHHYRLSACSARSTTRPRAWTSRCWSSSTAETSRSEPCWPNGTIARYASSARSISPEVGDRYRFLLHITNKIFPAIDK